MHKETLECDVLIVGAGVIGLAVASQLSKAKSVLLLEKNEKFGQETSSRNSEVIHSGIYYLTNSRKTELCIRGRELLYDFAEKHSVPHRACGKLVVSTEASDPNYLEKLISHCREVGVPAEGVGADFIQSQEPLVVAKRGVYLPKTGIIDSHILMQVLESQALQNGADIVYRHRIQSIARGRNGWTTDVSSDGVDLQVDCSTIINCAGLGAARLSQIALQTPRYEHRYCRGRYFTLSSRYRGKFNHLVYPTPQKDGLGIHVTIDMDGNGRLGPDVEWMPPGTNSEDAGLYECRWESIQNDFVSAARKYCPVLTPEDLSPGLIGVRPKLFVDGKAHPDFVVENHGGFIHCLGIESPGLTASLALADEVKKLL